MGTETIQPEEYEEKIIKTQNWELPESSLEGWLPYSATLLPEDLAGPAVKLGHGITLRKNLMSYWHGPRGSSKTLTMSYYNAKEMRMGKPVWSNYPISFYVAERGYLTGDEPHVFIQDSPCHWHNIDGTLSYYESRPLDMDKFYTFHRDIRKGCVSIDELQYFVEARTSNRLQNRIISYQIMQIRKTANSFFYTVQNPRWVDNRFGWSADIATECADISKMSYDRKGLDHELEEGEITQWMIKDVSGILTGKLYERTLKEYGPYQFQAHLFWNIYPTNFIIDIYEAMKGPVGETEKNEKDQKLFDAIQQVLSDIIDQGYDKYPQKEFWTQVASTLGSIPSKSKGGQYLASLGVRAIQSTGGKWVYDLKPLLADSDSAGAEEK